MMVGTPLSALFEKEQMAEFGEPLWSPEPDDARLVLRYFFQVIGGEILCLAVSSAHDGRKSPRDLRTIHPAAARSG